MQEKKNLYDQVYIAGISTEIWNTINNERNRTVSRNTVFLALKDEQPSTPLRQRIQEIARELLAKMQQPEPTTA